MKKILIIQANPMKLSYGHQLAEAYAKGAEESGAHVTFLDLSDLNFELNLKDGYSKVQELEPDLVHAQELIKEADHLVFVYPTWWSSFPALLKGFIDRVFLPGFAFKYRNGSSLWDKLLKGKTARIIITMDAPVLWYRFMNKQPGVHILKTGVLGFCGIKPVKVSLIGQVKMMEATKRLRWIEKMYKLGQKMN